MLDDTHSRIQEVLTHLRGVKQNGKGWKALCPAHSDSNPSLDIDLGRDGRKILLKCRAGCPHHAVREAAGLSPELVDGPKRSHSDKSRPRRTDEIKAWPSFRAMYEYEDENGKPLYAILRQMGDDGRKTMRAWRSDGPGMWRAGISGVRRVLYRLPQLIAGIKREERVLVVEGEKDVNSLRDQGCVATCNPFGAGKWNPEYAPFFRGADVAILPDNDDPGRLHAEQVARTLLGVATSIRIVDLPGMPPKGDVTDWLEAGGTREVLEQMMDQAPAWEPLQPAELDRGVYMADLANCKRLVQRHGENLRFCEAMGGWLVWTGTRWERDETGEAVRGAKDTAISIVHEAHDPSLTEKDRQELLKHAFESQKAGRISAMLKMAESELPLPVRASDLDADIMALNTKSGTIDLRTGDVRAHEREDLLTKLAPVEWQADAECPMWMAFLDRVMDGNQALIAFLQRTAGYLLTGDTGEEKVFVAYGKGRNGKGVYVETIAALLGEYAVKIPAEVLLEAKKADTQGPTPYLARLKGARFVHASETTEGRRLAEALVKETSGGDTLTARYCHANPFDFRPTHKILLATNHKPTIRGTDEAIWSRIYLIPFEITIPAEERDPHLKVKLRERELPGILRWALEGCLEWQRRGLQPPPEVYVATEAYRKENDILGLFMSERCMTGPGCSDSAKRLYDAYLEWCEEAAETPITQRTFGKCLGERGFERSRTNTHHRWSGLQLLPVDGAERAPEQPNLFDKAGRPPKREEAELF